jgi:hypothetical protein
MLVVLVMFLFMSGLGATTVTNSVSYVSGAKLKLASVVKFTETFTFDTDWDL